MTAHVAVAEAREALKQGDAERARRVLTPLGEDHSAAVMEALAQAAYLDIDIPRAIELWERSYAAYRKEGDQIGAIRVARTLGGTYFTAIGDFAVSRGWMARAETLLGDTESSERGWVALNIGMFTASRPSKEARFREALDVARQWGDADLEFSALAYLGASLVHGDRLEEGMLLLDEALAAVAGGEVDDFFVLEEIFCQLFAACEHAHDVSRADQWIRVGEAIAARRRLPSVAAFCRTHYGGILTAAGRWPEADETLTEAARLWAVGKKSVLRRGALARLADLRVRQGRLEEAGQLLEGLELDLDAARPLAALHLARGDSALAADVLDRALTQVDPESASAAPYWALLVDVRLAEGSVAAGDHAATALERCASRQQGSFLRAVAALARGRVCLASGTGDPHACLREALTGFARAELPMELAQCRLALAGALVEERPDMALAEARAALDSFERLNAARDVDEATALLRSLGDRTPPGRRTAGPLTKREAEVLALLGHGLSNPEISDRLFISRKTVEHHVGSILSKLGLRSRAEAAAYAARNPDPA